jgi:chorismate synthase
MLPSVRIMSVESASQLAEFPILERRVWGETAEVTPVDLLVAAVSEGGCAMGAYDQGNELVGIAFGFPTNQAGAFHSHYVAIDPTLRGAGLGRRLKLAQRDWCLENRYSLMRWTFDPLQTINAHLNLNVLGAIGVAYRVDMYGTLGGLNGDVPTDRLVMEWTLGGDPPEVPRIEARIAVPRVDPGDIAAGAPTAKGARLALRHELGPLMDRGLVVVSFDRNLHEYQLACS